jgi:hypothetical protein
MLIGVILAVQASVELPRITIAQVESGYRADAEPFDISREAAVGAEITRRARELCAGKQIRWGKFGSQAKIDKSSKELPKINGFFQEFRCVAPEQLIEAAVPDDWKASPTDDADVRRFFETYYNRRDAGQFRAAAAMFKPGIQENPSDANLTEFNRKLGTGARRITGVTWYVNPPDAPFRGAYAAVDFVGEFTGVHLYCGYLVLYRRGPGAYEIVREEQYVFHRGAEAPDPAQLASMRVATCREN